MLSSLARRRRGTSLVAVAVLGAAAVAGLLSTATFSDADGFVAAGRVLLSSHWQDTYADPWLQAGPFEQLVCLLARTVGGTTRGEAVALNLLAAAPLLLVARRALGAGWKTLLYVGGGAVLLGIVGDVYAAGHPAELYIALMWLLAARAARRDRALLAGLLLGLSAGFETWGLLGAPVLFLIPAPRRTVVAGALALGIAVATYAPFAAGGNFRMFHLHWVVAGGLDARLFGPGTVFTWQLRIAQALLVVAAGSALALALRRRTAACVWIVPAAVSVLKVLFDPVRYAYYWDGALVLLLIGTAPWFVAPRALAAQLRSRSAGPSRRVTAVQ